MLKLKFKLTALLAALVCAGSALAQDSGPLIDLLVRKGLINDQEGEELRADLARDASAAVTATVSGGKSTTFVQFSGRMQLQYVGLSSDQATATASQYVNQFFLRRVYFGVTAGIGAKWQAVLNYDFSGSNFDKAYMEWNGYWGEAPIALDFGLRKVNFGYEETTSSGSLKAIERSPVTRFFVEPNNGRRLGAASYRMGIFLDGGSADVRKGKSTGLFYGAAITNPQRTETILDAGIDGSKSSGSSAVNRPAYWANVGYSKVMAPDRKFVVGAAYGILPDVGGAGNTNFGKGFDIKEYSLYGDLTIGRFNLAGEYLHADVDGVLLAGTKKAGPSGYWIQPSYMATEKLELVGRYSQVDADGRGIRASDGIRSAPASKTGQMLKEYFLGVNYYFVNQDVKLQLGYVSGETSDGATEKVTGVRSQLQINF